MYNSIDAVSGDTCLPMENNATPNFVVLRKNCILILYILPEMPPDRPKSLARILSLWHAAPVEMPENLIYNNRSSAG